MWIEENKEMRRALRWIADHAQTADEDKIVARAEAALGDG